VNFSFDFLHGNSEKFSTTAVYFSGSSNFVYVGMYGEEQERSRGKKSKKEEQERRVGNNITNKSQNIIHDRLNPNENRGSKA
jgi:hypothetical protein